MHDFDDPAVATSDHIGSDLNADRAALHSRPELQNRMAETAACLTSLSYVPDAPVWIMMPRIY